MKKRLLFVAAIVAASTTFAQDGLTSKKGEAYLPEAGDWSISIDANPILNYGGNLLNGTAGQTFGGANWTNIDQAITGKMFKDENTAYRAKLRIGFSSNTQGTVNRYYTNPSDIQDAEFTDEVKNSSNNITLGFGLEKRRGNTRIQGVYGAMFSIGFGGSKTTNSYGLALNDSSIAANTDPSYANNTPRTLETKNGSSFNLGLQGFIGVEWFFAPKVSLGAEYTWGLSMTSRGEGETTTEKWGLNPGEVATNPMHIVTETNKTGKFSSFGIDTGLSGANISLNFHF